ncbi:MAG: preprotein translocase subunit SecE [Steroidobacteraceae bacterium]
MSEQVQESGVGALDIAKLVLAAAAVGGGIAAFYLLGDLPAVVKVLAFVAGVVAGLALAVWSAPGRQAWQFVLDSRVELRKMVWETRERTMKTTGIVFAFVAALGLFFWVVDWLLAWGTEKLLGQGG